MTMRNRRARFIAPILLMASLVHADMRELFDGTRLAAEAWECDPGVIAAVGEGGVSLNLKEKPYAAAAPQTRLEIDPEATLTISLADRKGDCSAQMEWIGEGGAFLKATPLFEAAGADVGVKQRKLTELLPADLRGTAKKFRVKFWLGGQDAAVTIREFTVLAPRRWQTPGIKTVHVYGPDSSVEPDKGLVVKKDGRALSAYTESGVPFSAFVLTDRLDYSPQQSAMLELAHLSPSATATVQVLCWDRQGVNIKAIDLMKDVAEAGVFEVPYSLYAEQFPPATTRVSFKIWLGGPSARMRLGALVVGETGKP